MPIGSDSVTVCIGQAWQGERHQNQFFQEVATMQRTLLIRGDLGHDYRSPIDTVLNGVLQSNPEMKLEQVTVLQIKETSCLLLCVFENGNRSDQTKAKKNN